MLSTVIRATVVELHALTHGVDSTELLTSFFRRQSHAPVLGVAIRAGTHSYVPTYACVQIDRLHHTLTPMPACRPQQARTLPVRAGTRAALRSCMHACRQWTRLPVYGPATHPGSCLDCLQISSFFTLSFSHQFLDVCMEH